MEPPKHRYLYSPSSPRKTPASTTSWLLRMYGCSCASSSLHPSLFSWCFRLSFCRDMNGHWKMPSHFHLHFENKKLTCPTRESPSFNCLADHGSAMDLSNQVLWVHHILIGISPLASSVPHHPKEQCIVSRCPPFMTFHH